MQPPSTVAAWACGKPLFAEHEHRDGRPVGAVQAEEEGWGRVLAEAGQLELRWRALGLDAMQHLSMASTEQWRWPHAFFGIEIDEF